MTTSVDLFTYQDILDCKKKSGAELALKPYDPKVFWDSMGEAWFNSFDHASKFKLHVAWILDRLKIMQADSLLEVGCGFGRLLPFFLQAEAVKTVEGVDISEKIIETSQKYLEPSTLKKTDYQKVKSAIDAADLSEDLKKSAMESADKLKTDIDKNPNPEAPDFRSRIKINAGDARKLEFLNDSFDVVLTSEVLQYLSPEDTEMACREILRVSKKWIILCERWAFPGEHSEPHIWSHNYVEIFQKMNVECSQVTTIGPGAQGVIVQKTQGV